MQPPPVHPAKDEPPSPFHAGTNPDIVAPFIYCET